MFRRRMKQWSRKILSKTKRSKGKINKICDILLMDILKADTKEKYEQMENQILIAMEKDDKLLLLYGI